MIKAGDRVPTWFGDPKDGKSMVLEVKPYDGVYKEFFTHTLRVSAPRTHRGWMEISYDAKRAP